MKKIALALALATALATPAMAYLQLEPHGVHLTDRTSPWNNPPTCNKYPDACPAGSFISFTIIKTNNALTTVDAHCAIYDAVGQPIQSKVVTIDLNSKENPQYEAIFFRATEKTISHGYCLLDWLPSQTDTGGPTQ